MCDTDERLGERLAARGPVAVQVRAEPRDVPVVMPRARADGPSAGGRLGGSNQSRQGLGSQVWFDDGRTRARLPADRAPGSWGVVVIGVPCASAATSTCLKRSGSTVAAGLGTQEPTGPGTATEARMAMSATLATTLRRRTSVGTLPRIAGSAWFRRGS